HVEKVREMLYATASEGFVGCVRALQAFDYSSGLAELEIPVLMVAGELDGSLPATMRENANLLADGRFLEIENAGHLSNLDNPLVFNRIIKDFLREHAY